MINKKGLGAVVSTSLLLLVAVAAIVGFQGWFQDFSSGTFSDVETKSSSGSLNTGIEDVIGNTIYFMNGNSENLSINSVTIDSIECPDLNDSYSSGIIELDVSDCISNITTSIPEIIIYTDTGLISETVFIKNSPSIFQKVFIFPPTTQWISYPLIDGEVSYEHIYDLGLDSQNNLYATGYMDSNISLENGIVVDWAGEYGSIHNSDFFLVKYDTSGTPLWATTAVNASLSEAGGTQLFVSENDDIYVLFEGGNALSYNYDFGNGVSLVKNSDSYFDSFVIKYNSSGVAQFVTNVIELNTADFNGFDLVVDDTENIYVVGNAKGHLDLGNGVFFNSTNTNFYLIKYNSSGDTQWLKQPLNDSESISSAQSVYVDSLGNIYVGGSWTNNLNLTGTISYTNDLDSNFFINKYDSDGNLIWSRTSDYGGQYLHEMKIVNNNIYVLGSLKFTSNNLTINGNLITTLKGSFIMKYDIGGNFIWAQSVGNTSEYVNNLVFHDNYVGDNFDVDDNENIYFTTMDSNSIITSFGNNSDGVSVEITGNNGFYLLKYDLNGIPIWVKRSENIPSGFHEGTSVVVDNMGGIYTSIITKDDNIEFDNEITSIHEGFDDFVIVKFQE